MTGKYITLLFLVVLNMTCFGQDTTLLKMLNDSISQHSSRDIVSATFKATQLVNLPTVEAPARNTLQFIIMHRFGRINEGAYEFFGLDNASIRLGFDYGITDKLSIGVGRSSLDKVYDGSFKYKIVRQANHFPITLVFYGLVTNTTLRYEDKPYLNTELRTAYTAQLLIARKFNSRLSVELAPGYTHYNLVPTPEDKNNLFTLSAGGRFKLTKRMSIDAEYNYLLPDQVVSSPVYNSLSLGFEIETGGHVFQLVFTNTQGMIGPWYLTKTDGQWKEGDIYFGFNVSRVFDFSKKTTWKEK